MAATATTATVYLRIRSPRFADVPCSCVLVSNLQLQYRLPTQVAIDHNLAFRENRTMLKLEAGGGATALGLVNTCQTLKRSVRETIVTFVVRGGACGLLEHRPNVRVESCESRLQEPVDTVVIILMPRNL